MITKGLGRGVNLLIKGIYRSLIARLIRCLNIIDPRRFVNMASLIKFIDQLDTLMFTPVVDRLEFIDVDTTDITFMDIEDTIRFEEVYG